MNTEFTELHIEKQFCFPLYALSRLVTKTYKPFLDDLGLTYTQYLVMLVLWEKDNIAVKEISEKLLLESNTLTPVLKKMEANELLQRIRSNTDERIVIIELTKKGKELIHIARTIPNQLSTHFENNNIYEQDILKVKDVLCEWLEKIRK
ncbi:MULTISPECIES: MarR family winged helix-turn-helix transcriptional regulator [Flavobacteriaceae]|uniref:MarR family winged helix-turn-helix transcriptional regulator n=1 Tax=Flavobacteriaceae TaxID=49546 RepID=UPI001CE1C9E2|nr:MarR family transcriptional regulator [Salegentibacter mishustinae]UBZ05624.1 MarR family transcriptional regulator [Salegentibacter mishustinae]